MYLGFIAAMMWGGMNASRPSKDGGVPYFERLLNHPEEKVRVAIQYAESQIEIGNFHELYRSFEGGDHKLPGVGLSYYTKLFSFLGETLEKVELKPLIFDKWLANAHCALLIQLKQQKEFDKLPYYQSISLQNKFTVNIPNGKEKEALYEKYLSDMNFWAKALNVKPTKLEEFLFGEALDTNKRSDNPRIELWKIIIDHCGNVKRDDEADDESDVDNPLPDSPPPSYKKTKMPKKGDRRIEDLNFGTTYYPLQEYFRKCNIDEVTLTITEIQSILGTTLPNWAFTRSRGYWGNSGEDIHVQKRAWLNMGYVVSRFSISEKERSGSVTFRIR